MKNVNILSWLTIGGFSIFMFMITAHIKIYLKDDPSIFTDYRLSDIFKKKSGKGVLNMVGTKMEFYL